MAYLGSTPTTQGFTPAIDYFSGNGSTVTFTLSRPVASVASIIVTVDNVVQNSGASAYTVSGNSITFSSAPLSGTNNIWVQYTSPITQTLGLTQDPSVVGDMTLTGGVYAVGDFGSGYSDGTIMDYVTGNGRITVGTADDLTFYHGGYYSRSALMTLSYAGNSTLYNNLSITGALTVATKINLPTWTTATRPSSPITGTQGYNTSTGQLEIYNSVGGWQNAGTAGNTYTASYLLVAGGGSGGTNVGGGGGAGGLLSSTTTLTGGTTYSFVVGAGGASQTGGANQGNSGSNSTAFSLTAIGGGGGGAYSGAGPGLSGGSGGGGGTFNSTAGGAGTAGQGYAGGTCTASGSLYATAGGGGAGAVGAGNSGNNTAGAGGVGAVTTIITTAQATSAAVGQVVSTSVYFAGGGGGSVYSGGTPGTGGSGGGTSGVAGSSSSAAAANTGGGSGGGANSAVSGNGGSGVFILSVPTSSYTGTTTGSPTVVTNGSNTVMIFKSSGSYTA